MSLSLSLSFSLSFPACHKRVHVGLASGNTEECTDLNSLRATNYDPISKPQMDRSHNHWAAEQCGVSYIVLISSLVTQRQKRMRWPTSACLHHKGMPLHYARTNAHANATYRDNLVRSRRTWASTNSYVEGCMLWENGPIILVKDIQWKRANHNSVASSHRCGRHARRRQTQKVLLLVL